MDVKDFDNYTIYPDGRLWSKRNNKYLKKIKGKSPYRFYILCQNSIRKNYMIHRLVAGHYIPNPENYPQVDHKDRNPENNDISNLRWVTREINSNNTGVNSRNILGFKYIRYDKKMGHIFRRKNCAVRASRENKALSRMLCYSFFYLLKHPP
tara:strand:- start:741 stop:1196 length:456 start_codon:yes stop_codon:yes gene_type:complete